MIIIAFIIVYIIAKISNSVRSVGVTTLVPHQLTEEHVYIDRPNKVSKTSHTVPTMKGGELMTIKARDRPHKNFKQEYRRWIDNVEEYNRMRNLILA